jgi:hypothetical protein
MRDALLSENERELRRGEPEGQEAWPGPAGALRERIDGTEKGGSSVKNRMTVFSDVTALGR